MSAVLRDRLGHIKQAIGRIHELLDGKTLAEVQDNWTVVLAVERCLEIVSEASRHIPASVQQTRPEIPWQQVADLGNVLRHAYHRSSVMALWDIYTQDLDALEAAIDAMRADLGGDDPSAPPAQPRS